MEISAIKQQLSMGQVLAHYGLPVKSGSPYMINCPFHDDRTPSLQIYPQTNTFCCFSSSCEAGTGDVIEFIRLSEKSSKHEAILKAKSMTEPMSTKTSSITKSAIFLRFWQSCQQGIKRSHQAKSYLQDRGLGGFVNVDKTIVGYCSEKAMSSWSEELKQAALKHGLLREASPKANAANGITPVLKHCLVFALLDKNHHPVGFYGRNIVSKKIKHVYVTGRKGLFPYYPPSFTKKLMITESVIDALTFWNSDEYTVLALYGTNGFTKAHEKALLDLPELNEVILFLDGDEAGNTAAKKLAEKLHQLNPDWLIKRVDTPAGEDANSLLTSHESGVIQHLIETAQTCSFAPVLLEQQQERKSVQVEKAVADNDKGEEGKEENESSQQTHNQLIEHHPSRLQFSTPRATYWIAGGLKNELDSLKVSIHIEAAAGKYRCRPDLYESKQAAKIAKECGLKLGLDPEAVEDDLSLLTDLLEERRASQTLTVERPKPQPIPEKEKGSLVEFLQGRNLLKRVNEQIGKSGVVGEKRSRLLLLIAASTYMCQNPLHILIQGSSGSGKTHLLGSICSLLPQQVVNRLTRVTDGSLYNYGEKELAHQLLAFEDMDGLAEGAVYALRELQSSHMLSSSTSGKDALGNNKGRKTLVRGPIASLACTTKGDIYEDNISRCLTVAVDESKEQTRRIIDHQNQMEAGLWQEADAQAAKLLVRRLIQLIKPLEVINPYAHQVSLPEGIRKERRLNSIYHILVRQVSLWHQYQRKRDAQGRVIAQPQDLELAGELMFESMVLKVDELDGQLRGFFEQLKAYVEEKLGQEEPFTQRQIRLALGISKTQLHRYMQSLLELEYIQIIGGHANRGYQYQISYWDDNKALRSRIKEHIATQIAQLKDLS